MQLRRIFLVLFFGLIAASAAAAAMADTAAWPAEPMKANWRGSGNYFSLVKLGCFWLVFLAWVRTTDWVNLDAIAYKLRYLVWNSIIAGTFFSAVLLFWLIPVFAVGFTLLLAAYVLPLIAYIVVRNQQVGETHQVLTPSHFRYLAAEGLGKVGVKIAAEKVAPQDQGPAIKLEGRGSADETVNKARTAAARQTEGFVETKQWLVDALARRATAVTLDYMVENVGTQYMIDGVWLAGEAYDRETGDRVLGTLKTLAGLRPADRQAKQQGQFGAELGAAGYNVQLTTQGVPTGERVVIYFESRQNAFSSLDEIGLRSKLEEQMWAVLGQHSGFVLFSASAASGLRSTFNLVLRKADRLTRDYIAVESENRRCEEVENVPPTLYPAGSSPANILPRVFRTEPDVIAIPDLVDGETVELLCRETGNRRLVLSTIRARDAVDAVLRVSALGVQPPLLANALSGVLYQRLIRKLCDDCKEAYAPTPQILAQLGLPPGRIESLYRPPVEPEKVCRTCGGVGYLGRTGLFEWMPVDDGVRIALAAGPKAETLRSAARKAGMRSLQEEGVVLVAKGITSLNELARVLKL